MRPGRPLESGRWAIAQKILDEEADCLLAVKDDWPALHAEIARAFDPATTGLLVHDTTDGDHGRIEQRHHAVSHRVAFLDTDRRSPGEPRCPGLKAVAMVETEVERAGKTSRERQNRATVRHVALDLLRGAEDKHSLEVRRKSPLGTTPSSKPSSAMQRDAVQAIALQAGGRHPKPRRPAPPARARRRRRRCRRRRAAGLAAGERDGPVRHPVPRACCAALRGAKSRPRRGAQPYGRHVDLVAERAEVAIRMGDLPDSGLVARRLTRSRRVVCTSTTDLAVRGTSTALAKFDSHDGLDVPLPARPPSRPR